ncbi:NAD-dependent epimerase/dehydratase family protein [Nibricoccus sp. IMCC34717]|uniref:NAD-dependent epimerase/dehydratase family protein n=1 Tax=Nibricoccus sp. IMCC34717 TaxID=3034021 RepID=UPI00384E1B83
MICLVTGAAGFIASHLCDLLLSHGHRVIGVDDFSTGRDSNLTNALKSPRFTLLRKSINAIEGTDVPVGTVDWVFHLAGRADLVPSIQNPEDYFKVNVEGTFRVLQLARTLNAKRFLYAASSTCYGLAEVTPTPENYPCAPRHPYGLTKYLGEQLVMHWSSVYKLPAISLRLFNVYGPRSRTTGAYGAVFGVFLKQKLAKQPFTVVGDGKQTRDFTFVTDVAAAFMAAADSEVSGEIMNVGSGNTYSINSLVKLLGGEVVYVPKRPGEPDCTFADTSRILSRIQWKPTVSLEEGVARMLAVIDDWRDAPLWNQTSIAEATKDWFKYLS